MRKTGGLFEWALLVLPLAAYVVGFFAYLPRGPVNSDEASYMAQARALARGQVNVDGLDPFTCRPAPRAPSPFPAATAALQSHFVRFGGWEVAALLSPLTLCLAVLTLAVWLHHEGFSPLFALLLLTFLPTLVAGRVALSDVPTTALVTLATAFFFVGSGERPILWLGAGILGGLSLMFRDVGPVYFLAYFAAPILRRERAAWILVLGVLVGLAATSLSSWIVFGHVVRMRGQAYGWDLPTFLFQAPFYFAVLLAGVPGSPITTFLYRGRRRAEVIATVLIVFVFFSAYKFGGWESGGWKVLVLGPRYFLPLAPTLVLTVAEVVTRRWLPRFGGTLPSGLAATAALAATVLAIAVHPVLHRWSESQWRIAEALYANTPEQSAVITNEMLTIKYWNEVRGLRAFSNRVTPELLKTYHPGPVMDRSVLPEGVPSLYAACGAASIALLDRTDTAILRQDAATNDEFVASVGSLCRLTPVTDLQATATDRLRIWRVGPCGSSPR